MNGALWNKQVLLWIDCSLSVNLKITQGKSKSMSILQVLEAIGMVWHLLTYVGGASCIGPSLQVSWFLIMDKLTE